MRTFESSATLRLAPPASNTSLIVHAIMSRLTGTCLPDSSFNSSWTNKLKEYIRFPTCTFSEGEYIEEPYDVFHGVFLNAKHSDNSVHNFAVTFPETVEWPRLANQRLMLALSPQWKFEVPCLFCHVEISRLWVIVRQYNLPCVIAHIGRWCTEDIFACLFSIMWVLLMWCGVSTVHCQVAGTAEMIYWSPAGRNMLSA